MKPSLWVAKYRPNTIDDVIFQDDRQRATFQGFVKNGDIPHLFLAGVQGTGKTSISRAIIRDLKVDPSDVMKINCSDEKIDALRSKVSAFAMTLPMGAFKVVRLEEMDHLSLDGQALLRTLIEESQSTCRFIATCNYSNKVITPLKSRFQEFYFRAPDKEQVLLRMADILEGEKVRYDADDVAAYLDVGYPDIRKVTQLLQANSQGGKLLSPRSAEVAASDWKFGLLDAINKGDFRAARKLVCESATREEHEDVFTFLYQNVGKMNVSDQDAAVITIAEFMYKHALCADTELNLAALFISLGKL